MQPGFAMSYRIYRFHSRVGSQGSSADGIMHHVIRANGIYAADCCVSGIGIVLYNTSSMIQDFARKATTRRPGCVGHLTGRLEFTDT